VSEQRELDEIKEALDHATRHDAATITVMTRDLYFALQQAAAAPTQPAGELRDKIESIVQWASTKTPCGDNYQCLLSDLQAALGREGK
jgi:hypothetical protein